MSAFDLAAALAAAHGSDAAVVLPAGQAPADFDAAFAVQGEVARRRGAGIAGWKAGFGPGDVPVAAPLYASLVQPSPAVVTLPARTQLIVEAELGFRLARDLPPRPGLPYSRGEVRDAIAAVVVGFELIASRFGDHTKVPFEAFLADNLGNAGYVEGTGTREFRTLDLATLRCTLRVDGAVASDRAGGHPQNDPLLPLVAWANAARDRLGGLRAGHVVTTGSVAIARLSAPARVAATIAGIGAVEAAFVR